MPVAAAPPEGADLNSPLAGWYKSLRVPPTGGENAGMSCCSIADCRPAKARLGAAGWEIERGASPPAAGEIWEEVPEAAVLQRDNPTGGAVVCVYFGKIRCFVPPDLW